MIPLYRPSLGSKEKKLLAKAFDTSWISGFGPYVDEFEEKFAEQVGRNHAVAVSNGTVALHLALHALGAGPNDQVISPTYTYVATANAPRYVGARVVLTDSDSTNYQPDILSIRRATKESIGFGILPHLFGYPNDFSSLTSDPDLRGIKWIEDCSEMFGATLHGNPAGGDALISTYSFFGNKTITTGEGGMVVTDDQELANYLKKLKSQSASEGNRYFFDELGFNFRMTNLQAAIGVAQLSRLPEILERKRALFYRYQVGINLPEEAFLGDPNGGQSSFWMVTLRLPSVVDRAAFIGICQRAGVDVRPAFIPMHLLPMFEETASKFPGVESFHQSIIFLPSFPDLSIREQNFVIDTVNRALSDATGSS